MRHGYGRQRGQLEQVHYHRVLEELGLSSREFVEFCVLCGCDFTGKLPPVSVPKQPSIARGRMLSYDCCAVVAASEDLFLVLKISEFLRAALRQTSSVRQRHARRES